MSAKMRVYFGRLLPFGALSSRLARSATPVWRAQQHLVNNNTPTPYVFCKCCI